MCGITGFWGSSSQSVEVLSAAAEKMADSLRHRGPDGGGVWVDNSVGIVLGHRRLAILELSTAGHQPMVSRSGRYVIAFNGEIYNHLQLRGELDGLAQSAFRQPMAFRGGEGPEVMEVANWRGHADTETLLAGIEAWGLEATLRRCVGMFAIALWDRLEQKLQLARDRFGEKPLYYGRAGGVFLFGSELKALKAFPNFSATVSREAIAHYLRFMNVPAPLSIYEGIYKLEPGSLLTLTGKSADVQVRRWWAMEELVESGLNNPVYDEGEALQLLEERLIEAVRLQSLADVPLGAFLSGGVDSSAIVALMQRDAMRPVKTFTVGFAEVDFDESRYARAVAHHLGTDHHEMRITAEMALDVIPLLPRVYDEPFADSSQIPTHLVCRAARQHVTVALSGDAGDELFGGYNRYLWGPRLWSQLSWLPFSVRRRIGHLIRAFPSTSLDFLSGLAGVSRLGEKAQKLATGLDSIKDIDDLYWSLVSNWQDGANIVRSGEAEASFSHFSCHKRAPKGLNSVQRMMFLDTVSYLPGDILCKLDRAAMACGLETRVPFLDHRVVGLAWQLPHSMKVRANTGKWALRKVLYKYVPSALIERPKVGFAVPVGQWLRGPLRDWAETLLAEFRLSSEGYFKPEPIREIWHQHLVGRSDRTSHLWPILMFQAWLEENI